MTHRLATNYAKNYRNRTPIVKVIVENVVTCFFGTQCRRRTNHRLRSLNYMQSCLVIRIWRPCRPPARFSAALLPYLIISQVLSF